MDLPHPRSLTDVITDGLIAQADTDVAFRAGHGQVTGVEFTAPAPTEAEFDAAVDVRLHHRTGSPTTARGIRLAMIREGSWTWLTDRTTGFDIPELQEPQTASDDLLRAARTLVGNIPVLLAPHGDGTASVIALPLPLPTGAVRTALINGLTVLDEHRDVRRALLGFAAARGLGIRERGEEILFSDGTRLTLRDGRVTHLRGGLNLEQVRADALYLSAEHQLLLDGRFPSARLTLDLGRGTATLVSATGAEMSVGARVVATVTAGTWTWAWADRNLTGSPTALAAAGLRRFGVDHGLPALFRPSLPADEAQRLGLMDVVKPVSGMWTDLTVPLSPETTGIVLLEAEQLRLPTASTQAVAATLQAPVPPGLDLQRALRSYAEHRGLDLVPASDGAVLVLPTTGERVTVTIGAAGLDVQPG